MLEDYNSSDAQKDEIAQGVCAGILTFINSLQEEPASEDLKLASERYACKFSNSKYGYDKIKTAFKAGANWQEEQDNICYEEIFEEGAAWKAQEASEWLADNADYYGDDTKALQIDFDRAMAIENKNED